MDTRRIFRNCLVCGALILVGLQHPAVCDGCDHGDMQETAEAAMKVVRGVNLGSTSTNYVERDVRFSDVPAVVSKSTGRSPTRPPGLTFRGGGSRG